MLYDPKWEQQTKADPFTLHSLIAWLEKQPANEAYCYLSGHCLFDQYFEGIGMPVDGVGGTYIRFKSNPRLKVPLGILQNIPMYTPHTFGAALERARAVAR